MALDAGVMTVCVEYAQNLKDCDWFGRQDPYCVLTCGTQTYRTRTAKDGGKSPVWNESFRFNVINENEVVLLIKDEDVGRDDVIGTARVNLARARVQGSEKVSAPVVARKGGKQHGFVSVSLTFAPNSTLRPTPPQPYYPQHHAPQQQAPPFYAQHYAAPPAYYAPQPYPGAHPYPQAPPPAPYYQQPAPYAYPPQPAPQQYQQPQGHYPYAYGAPSAPPAPSAAQSLGPPPPGYPAMRSATIGA